MPDPTFSVRVPTRGNIAIKILIFILLSAVLLFIILTSQSDKNKVFDDVEKVKIGMTRSQVFKIMGSPKRSEKAPFLKERSPSGDILVNGNNASEKISRALQRDRYELLWFTSGNKADIWGFDVYYNARLKVCYLYHWRTDGWVLTE